MRFGNVLSATNESSTRSAADACSWTSSRNAPPPRTAVVTSAVAWFTTIAASGPCASSAQRLVAQYGRLRDALLDPSTGSTTTVIGARGAPVTPDSSLTMRRS